MDSKTKEILIGLLDWHEDNARELENEEGQENEFKFHYQACEALAEIIRIQYTREKM